MLTTNSIDTLTSNTETVQGVKTAKLVQNQQEIEAKMALELIQSATTAAPLAASGNSGQHVNIKV